MFPSHIVTGSHPGGGISVATAGGDTRWSQHYVDGDVEVWHFALGGSSKLIARLQGGRYIARALRGSAVGRSNSIPLCPELTGEGDKNAALAHYREWCKESA